MKLFCAWCPTPKDEQVPEDQSHGICDEHAKQLQDQSDARHWKDVPSYFCERERFEQYREKRKRK